MKLRYSYEAYKDRYKHMHLFVTDYKDGGTEGSPPVLYCFSCLVDRKQIMYYLTDIMLDPNDIDLNDWIISHLDDKGKLADKLLNEMFITNAECIVRGQVYG